MFWQELSSFYVVAASDVAALLRSCFVCLPISLSSILHPRSSILDLPSSTLAPYSTALLLCDKSLRLRHFLFERVKKTSRKRFAVQLHGSLGFHPRFGISLLFIQ